MDAKDNNLQVEDWQPIAAKETMLEWTGDLSDDCTAEWAGLCLRAEWMDGKDWWWSVYQTYNGYVMSQFKRMQADLRNQGKIKPKHVMHLIRLLLSGIHVLRNGLVDVDVGEHREQLFPIKNEEMPWDDIEAWRKELHKEFDRALTCLSVLTTNGRMNFWCGHDA